MDAIAIVEYLPSDDRLNAFIVLEVKVSAELNRILLRTYYFRTAIYSCETGIIKKVGRSEIYIRNPMLNTETCCDSLSLAREIKDLGTASGGSRIFCWGGLMGRVFFVWGG